MTLPAGVWPISVNVIGVGPSLWEAIECVELEIASIVAAGYRITTAYEGVAKLDRSKQDEIIEWTFRVNFEIQDDVR